jgi:hypothetical protein
MLAGKLPLPKSELKSVADRHATKDSKENLYEEYA